MSAAAPAPFKSPGPPRLDLPDPYQDGYLMVPRCFVQNLPRGTDRVAGWLIMIIWDNTAGGKAKSKKTTWSARPQWFRATLEHLAECVNATVDGVRKALADLVKAGLIACYQVPGHRSYYRVLYENISKLEAKAPRRLQSIERAEELRVRDRHVIALRSGVSQPFAFDQPVEKIELTNLTGDALPELPVEVVSTAGVAHIRLGSLAGEKDGSKPTHRKEDKKGERARAEGGTPVPPSIAQVIDFLTPYFRDLFHKPVDKDFAGQIREKLGKATLEGFARTIAARLQRDGRRGKVHSGLFLNLAEDAAREAAQSAQPPAAPIPISTFVSDSEDIDNPWTRLRRYIKETAGEQAYSNWFARSRLIAFDGAEMRVAVPDQISVDFIEQEYSGAVRGACLHVLGRTIPVEFVAEQK